jgi:hypothetical protein
MVILSVGLMTLSATAARIHGMRLNGTATASVPSGAVPVAPASAAATMPGS